MASKSDFICRVRYRNRLPAIPFPPKLLATQSLAARNVQYSTNSLIEQTPHLLTLDSSSSIPFDKLLVDYLDMMETNPDVARASATVADEDKLLMTPPRDEKDLNKQHGRQPNVTWLRRSEYIAAAERKQKTATIGSTEMRSKLTQQDVEAHTYRTFESQIAGVEATFTPHDLNTLRHPRTKKRAVRLTPILPDMKCWQTVYTIGQFPADPADNSRLNKRKRQDSTSKQPSELDAADRGILRPISNPHDPNDSYLIWFLPDDGSSAVLKRQKIDTQHVLDEPLNFEAVRDYTYRNDNAPGHQNLLLTLGYDDAHQPVMRYNLVKSKLVAQKKRALNRGYRNMDDYEKPNVLSVTYQ